MKLNTLLLLLLTFDGFSQSICHRYQLAYQAEQLYMSSATPEKAVSLYSQAMDEGLKTGSFLFYAIHCATKTKDRASTLKFLRRGLEIGFSVANFTNSWQNFGNGENLDSLLSEIDTMRLVEVYAKPLNHALIAKMAEMKERDQLYRDESDEFWNLQRANDSLNWKELKTITEALGHLPTQTALGMQGTEDMEILFYHMDRNEIEWFLPYVIKNIQENESGLGQGILYQLERIGLDDETNYTITADYKIIPVSKKTRMQNGLLCQNFGEWFSEYHAGEKVSYFTPLDPQLNMEEINRVRNMLCLDDVESKCKRRPRTKVVSIQEFEAKIRM